MPASVTHRTIVHFNDAFYSDLISKAEASDRKRSHQNLHEELDDPFQRMVIAIQPDSYVRPHFHARKPELLVCLRGELGVMIFESNGDVKEAIRLTPGPSNPGCEIPAGTWHSLVALSEGTIFLEAKPGPYTPFSPEDFASWAPEADTDDVPAYMNSLRDKLAGESPA